ncbi:SAM-dependent methyltransferase [Sphingomonas sp. BE138]|uniref:class I SAM-dependent methyltransferase n=1 Tax=Sphingomonas sp. BE138 TaxID=2817845 RepID=UPI0028554D2E|nr:class I SAM-dependent methyltransferase [Sphingomonas sp. BE138]MDR6787463.1 SAM-dependent methyltransferase [Sphingomonas sp. BE138]
MDTLAKMKEAWNVRAQADAEHYIETDHWDGDRDAFFALGEKIVHEIADPYLPARRTLAVDIGCGVGRLTRALSTRFDKAIGLDVSDEMVRKGTDLQRDTPKVQLIATDGVTFPIETGTADFVFSYVVFQHMPSIEVIKGSLAETRRILAPGGAALLHLKHRYKNPLHAAWQNLPEAIATPLQRLRGSDPLKMSESYRGVGPISDARLRAMFADAGLKVQKMFDDRTHVPTHEYVWVHATV